MSAITTKFITDHKLTNEMSLKELSQYVPEILKLLTTGTLLVDKEKRRQACNHLQKEYEFSKEQVFALISHERIGWNKSQVTFKEGVDVNICLASDITLEEVTIKQMAQCIMKDKLSEKNVKTISRILVETSSNAIVTRLSNKVQKEHSEQYKNEEIDFPDHFLLESVKKKLDEYDVSNISNKQALAN
ncbi:2789_t:CDS:2, partial [Cetraspora pellucida]